MSEVKQYVIKVRSTYEHTISVDVDMDAYRDIDDSIENYIESEIDAGELGIPIPMEIEDDFYAYELVSVEPIELPAKPSEESL